jgi:hypothetical protein
MRWRFVAVLVGALCAYPALAQADSFDPVSFGAHASTLGYGITIERPLLFDLSVRATTGALSSTSQPSYDGNQWSSTFRQNNVLVAMDWRPYAGRWRLSGGLLFGSDHIDKVALSSGGNVLLNGTAYPAAGTGTVSSRISFARPAVYLGVGAGTGILKGLTIAFDAGIVIRNGSLSTSATGPLAANAQFQNDLATTSAQFRTRLIQPVIGVGIVFRP